MSNNNARKRSREDVDNGTNSESIRTFVTLDSVLNTNFEEVARQLPSFGEIWRQHTRLQTPEVRSALAQALLWVHWGISTASLPVHHLAPPIPNRYFFVRWLLDSVLPLTPNWASSSIRSDKKVYGLDIGTGAYCVYPLLMVASSSMYMFATDVDTASLQCAQQHLDLNPKLAPRIRLLHVPPSDRQQQHPTTGSESSGGPLLQSLKVAAPQQQLLFCMTNPPFYDVNEATNNVSAMTFNEGHYPGGEIGFCLDMIVDGLTLFLQQGNNNPPPVWTCTMCGKKSSWIFLRNVLLQLLGFSHVCATEFAPKNLARCFLAWTFEKHPPGDSSLAQHLRWEFAVVQELSMAEIEDRLRHYCASFPGGALVCESTMLPSQANFTCLQITESGSTSGWKGDDALPACIQRLLAAADPKARNDLLPREGHFVWRVRISLGCVQVEAFMHSTNGKAVTEKMQSQLQGEVCRTSRFWRRKLKQQQI